MKDILKSVLYFLAFLACVALAVGTNIFLIDILSVLPIVVCCSRGIDHAKGNMVKGSVFSAYRSGRIRQYGLCHPIRILSFVFDKDKTNRFLDEAITTFTQLKQFDSNDEPMTYNVFSQAMTLQLLRRMEREGYVCNLSYQKAKKSRLILPKLYMGRLPDFKKKYQMYNISFNLTDKARDFQELRDMIKNTTGNDTLKDEGISQQKVNVAGENRVSSSRAETVAELENLKSFVMEQNGGVLHDEGNIHSNKR